MGSNPDKGQYFVKSLLLNLMKLKKKVPLLQAKVHFEPQKLKYLLQKMTVSLKFISKILKIFGDNLLIARGFEAVNLCKKSRYHSNGHSNAHHEWI
jgi:hypothetical protein